MGIDNLLPLLQPITKQLHLSYFKGKILGIDISPWLYKACYMDIMQMDDTILSSQFQRSIRSMQPSHESNLIEDENKSQNKSQNIKKVSCVSYLLDMISLFEQNGVKMFAVYDGRSLGMKQKTIKKRKQNKENNLEKGRKLLDKGNKSEVRKYLSRGIRISQSIVEQSMRILKSKNIQFIVAPYQSDSQLCKMYRMSIIDAVVSEDSDFIVYGCKVLYKLDQEGMCEYIDLTENHQLDLIANEPSEAVVKNKRKNMKKVDYQNLQAFLNLDPDSRILACILAGCDYVPSIKGIGIKKAIKLVTNEPEPKKLLSKLKQDKLYNQHIPDSYEEDVEKAYTIFKYSLVFNILTNNLEPLSSLQNGTIQQFQAIGQPYPQYLSLFIYSGSRTCTTLQLRNLSPIRFEQSTSQIKMRSLRNIKSEIGHRFKESMQIQQDDELKSISGQNYMLEVFQNYEKELETGLQNYINICVENLIL